LYGIVSMKKSGSNAARASSQRPTGACPALYAALASHGLP
jgi:hypothetical protein